MIVNSSHKLNTTIGTSYYLSSSGDDGDDGLTPETAWETIAHALATIAFSPGDRLLLNGGDVFRESIALADVNGSRIWPIHISSYGTGRAELRASDAADNWTLGSGTTYISEDIATEPLAVIDTANEKSPQYMSSQAEVESTVDSWWWDDGALYVNVGGNPAAGQIECVVRDDAIELSECSHIKVHNLNCSYTGTDEGGYAVRVSPRCEYVDFFDIDASWGGKHHFAILSSNQCYGYRLNCSKWTQGKGDATSTTGSTALVSFADDANPLSTTGWKDCVTADLANGMGGNGNAFVVHGDGMELCNVVDCSFDSEFYIIPQTRDGAVNVDGCTFNDCRFVTTQDGTDPTITQPILLKDATMIGAGATLSISAGDVTQENITYIP